MPSSKRKIGDICVMTNGYRITYLPSHPKAFGSNCGYHGFVYEHVLVAEKMLGRPLESEEEVHHLDGNRQNNHMSNLLVLYSGMHTRLHNFLRNYEMIPKKTVIRDPVIPRCEQCNLGLYNGQKRFCSAQCRTDSQLKGIRPSKEQLMEDVQIMTPQDMARKYNVALMSIKRWLKNYNLS